MMYQNYDILMDSSTITTYGRELWMKPPLLERVEPILNLKKRE